MRKIVTLIVLVFIFLPSTYSQEREGLFKYFFKPRPVVKALDGTNLVNTPRFEAKPTVQIPAIKLTESIRENAQLDATFLASAGGGLTIQRTTTKNGKNYALYSWSPAIFLLTGDTSKDNPLDISYCTSFGFFNNIMQVGVGYDFGVVVDRSRWFGVLSFGFNLTNN